MGDHNIFLGGRNFIDAAFFVNLGPPSEENDSPLTNEALLC